MTYGNAPRTQAEWDAKRAEVKAEAAKTVEANRVAALQALRTLRDQANYPADVLRNEVGEVETEAPDGGSTVPEEEEEVKPYGEWTNDALSEELKARELPHSGTKDEMVSRLEESDKTEQA